MNQKKNEPKNNLEKFSPQDVRDLYEEFQVDNWALQAFGHLLYNSNFGSFTDDYVDSDELRHGLNQIVELYLERQQEKLEEIYKKSCNCPEDLICRAKHSYEIIINGRWSSDPRNNLEKINEHIEDMKHVLSEFQPEEYPEALSILHKLEEERARFEDKPRKSGVQGAMQTGDCKENLHKKAV